MRLLETERFLQQMKSATRRCDKLAEFARKVPSLPTFGECSIHASDGKLETPLPLRELVTRWVDVCASVNVIKGSCSLAFKGKNAASFGVIDDAVASIKSGVVRHQPL